MLVFRAVVLSLVLAKVAAAQRRPDTAAVLTPITITASRGDTLQNVATSGSTVLWGAALRARGITTVAAALREVPSAALMRGGAPGSQASLFLRGGESDYVQVLIDGIAVNEPGGSFNFANLTLDDVERIEVVRGPASVLYGSDAMTGVIQIFTRQAAEARRGELRAQGGQRGGVDLDGNLTGRVGGAALSVGGGMHRSNGIYDFNNEWRSDAIGGNVRLGRADRSSIVVRGRYADARYNYPTESWGAPLDSNSFNTERRLTYGVDAARRLSPSVRAYVSGGVSRFQGISTDPSNGPGDFDSHFESFSSRRNVDARIDARVRSAGTVSVGTDLDWQHSEGTGEDQSNGFFRRWSRGGYAQFVGDAARLSYSLGARTEKNERFGSFTTVRASTGIRLSGGMTLRGGFGTAFKEPTFCELSGCGFATANAGLDPERGRSWEVGLEQQLGTPSVVLGVTYFDQEFRDLIQFGSDSYVNVNAAFANGWEIEAVAGTGDGPTARASFSILDAEDRSTSQRLLRRPRTSGSLVLSTPGRPGVLITTDVTFVGRRDDLRFAEDFSSVREDLPSHTLVGLGMSYTPPRSPTLLGRGRTPPLELTARIDNLLNKEYEMIAGFATPRRTASAGVRVVFGW